MIAYWRRNNRLSDSLSNFYKFTPPKSVSGRSGSLSSTEVRGGGRTAWADRSTRSLTASYASNFSQLDQSSPSVAESGRLR